MLWLVSTQLFRPLLPLLLNCSMRFWWCLDSLLLLWHGQQYMLRFQRRTRLLDTHVSTYGCFWNLPEMSFDLFPRTVLVMWEHEASKFQIGASWEWQKSEEEIQYFDIKPRNPLVFDNRIEILLQKFCYMWSSIVLFIIPGKDELGTHVTDPPFDFTFFISCLLFLRVFLTFAITFTFW